MTQSKFVTRIRNLVFESRVKTSVQLHHIHIPNATKRDYTNAFGERKYDIERYGQEIADTFFQENIGHNIYE